MNPHRWWQASRGKRSTTAGLSPYPICVYCGLLRLRNQATDAAVRKTCPGARNEDK